MKRRGDGNLCFVCVFRSAILDLAKLAIYQAFYETFRPMFQKRVAVCMSDTGTSSIHIVVVVVVLQPHIRTTYVRRT